MSIDKATVIAEKGLSFDIIRRTQLFPPLEILNSFWQCGIDDAASEITIQWEPFLLGEADYDSFLRRCRDRFGPLKVDSLQSDNYSDWFSEAAVRYSGS